MLNWKRSLIAVLSVLVFSCTYSLTGFFPRQYKYIALLSVENETDNLQMTALVRDVFNRLVLSDTRLQLQDEKNANVLTKIYIKAYDRKPEKYDQNGNITDYRYTVNLSVEFLKKDSSVLIERTSYIGTGVLNILAPQDSAYKVCIYDALKKAFSDYFNKLSTD